MPGVAHALLPCARSPLPSSRCAFARQDWLAHRPRPALLLEARRMSHLCASMPAAVQAVDSSCVAEQTHTEQDSQPAAAGGRARGGAQQQSRKRKRNSPLHLLRMEVVDAIRAKDPAAALAAHDAAVAKGIPLSQDLAEAMLQRGRQLAAAMRAAGRPGSEMAYTALARMAAQAGRPDEAYAAVQELLAAKSLPVRLRAFVPALQGYCAAGEVDKAFQVDADIAAAGLDLTEEEFAALLRVCAAPGGAAHAPALLARIGRELTRLQAPTLAAAEAYFASEGAASALAASGRGARWRVERCTVSGAGVPSTCCEGQLQGIDLDDEEWDTFARGIAQLALQREKSQHFRPFQEWLERHGPFDAVLDGANIALFGQNFGDGGFVFKQVEATLAQLRRDGHAQRPLLVLHESRTHAPWARRPAARKLLSRLAEEHSFYVAPHGSNDDWYWMYAAVRAGGPGLLVSNDEMRDHELFTRHRLYSVMVRKSRHPQLNGYIRSIVQSMQAPLVRGLLGKVAVLILDSRGCVVEKYAVQLQCHMEILASLDVDDVEAALRSCLLKLQFADACLKPARKGCTFEVVAYAAERGALPLSAWVEAAELSGGAPTALAEAGVDSLAI
ncbi:hypothetical protein WJX81_001690 [Elliptochloris bilobata]|uniref:Mitochondrial ribonuclease P catalytic subunit n=1 Tax=Elliptochloris bilobata TaxID=381761 RepID=A0AAW1QZV2_9CHLO